MLNCWRIIQQIILMVSGSSMPGHPKTYRPVDRGLSLENRGLQPVCQDEIDREGLNVDSIAKSLVVYRKLARVGGYQRYREGPTALSLGSWCGVNVIVVLSIPSSNDLVNQVTITMHLHIGDV